MTIDPTRRPVRAEDALKYAAAKLRLRIDDCSDDDKDESSWTPAGRVAATQLRAVLAVFDQALCGDRDRYSDGRRLVESTAECMPAGNGIVHSAHHVWHPDPAAEEPASCRSALPDDPDGRSLGFFQVMTDRGHRDHDCFRRQAQRRGSHRHRQLADLNVAAGVAL